MGHSALFYAGDFSVSVTCAGGFHGIILVFPNAGSKKKHTRFCVMGSASCSLKRHH